MLYFLIILGMGVGIGISVSSSETTDIGNGIIRTEYLREIYGNYNAGWRYDRATTGGMHDLSFKLFKKSNEQLRAGWGIPLFSRPG